MPRLWADLALLLIAGSADAGARAELQVRRQPPLSRQHPRRGALGLALPHRSPAPSRSSWRKAASRRHLEPSALPPAAHLGLAGGVRGQRRHPQAAGDSGNKPCVPAGVRRSAPDTARRCRRREVPLTEGRELVEPTLWNLWAQPYYTSISDERYGLDVDTELASLTLGIDRRIGDDFVLGALISFQNSESDGFDSNLTVEAPASTSAPTPPGGFRRNWALDATLSFGRYDNDMGARSGSTAATTRSRSPARSPRTGSTLSRNISSARRPPSPTATSPTTATTWSKGDFTWTSARP